MSEEQQESTSSDQDSPSSSDNEGSKTSGDGEEKGSELETSEPGEVGDDKLPEDLQPTEDNPLARHPGQTGEEDDLIGAAGDEDRAKNPSASMGYGSAGSDDADGSDSQDDDSRDDDSQDDDPED